MREEILKQFLTEEVDAKVLADDLVGSMVTKGDMTKHPIEDMAERFQLGPEHLIRLCDAVLRDEIKPQYLQSIGFCIVASDNLNMTPIPPMGILLEKQFWIGQRQ